MLKQLLYWLSQFLPSNHKKEIFQTSSQPKLEVSLKDILSNEEELEIYLLNEGPISDSTEDENSLIMSKTPLNVENEEIVIRSIFSPYNIRKNGELKSNTFQSPGGKDEVSVNRLSYTTEDFCKKNGLLIATSGEKSKTFIGLAKIKVQVVRDVDADVISSPIKTEPKNLAHADIIIGYIRKSGEQLPAEHQYKLDEITKSAILQLDPNPSGKTWEKTDEF